MVTWALLKAREGSGHTPGSAPTGQVPVSVLSVSFVPQLHIMVTPLLTLGSCSVFREAGQPGVGVRTF